MTDREGKLRRGAEAVKQVYLYAVGGENVGDDFGELAGVVAHVVAHGDGNLRHVGESLFEVVGQALGGGTHGVYVHAVSARAHYAAQAACSEFEVAVESLDEGGRILCLEHLFDLGAGGLVVVGGKPAHGALLDCFQQFFLVFHIVL